MCDVHVCDLWRACASSHLTEQPVGDAAGQLLSFRNLVGDSLLLVQLLGEHLQLGQSELQGQAVHVALRRVLQHVLEKVTRKVARKDAAQFKRKTSRHGYPPIW